MLGGGFGWFGVPEDVQAADVGDFGEFDPGDFGGGGGGGDF